MPNDFQIWLMSQGYYRKDGDLEWMKDGVVVSGNELYHKLNEWKKLT